MWEGEADLGLEQRPLGAKIGREGLRYSWCSCIELGGGPIGKGGRALEIGGVLALYLGKGRLVCKVEADSRLQQRRLGAETGRVGFRNWWCSCFVLGGGLVGGGWG